MWSVFLGSVIVTSLWRQRCHVLYAMVCRPRYACVWRALGRLWVLGAGRRVYKHDYVITSDAPYVIVRSCVGLAVLLMCVIWQRYYLHMHERSVFAEVYHCCLAVGGCELVKSVCLMHIETLGPPLSCWIHISNFSSKCSHYLYNRLFFQLIVFRSLLQRKKAHERLKLGRARAARQRCAAASQPDGYWQLCNLKNWSFCT